MHPAIGVLLAYIAGSIPFALLAGRARGLDLRQHGSGNLGATNAVRVLGPVPGGLVYVADTLKGLLPVLLLPGVTNTGHAELWAIAYGVASILGHVFPVFLLGKGGGKGVATAGGVFFALAWVAALTALVVFVVALAATRIVSVASIAASLALPLAVLVWRGATDPLFPVSLVIGLLVILAHRANFARLRRGEEPRIGAGSGKRAGVT
ncbi:MAG: glycerol-3-phosphate 1-O-acyltransferase PlsY [Gemmatimonadaceae bacterium]